MIIAQITNSTTALDSIASGLHYYLPQVSLTQIITVLLLISKGAQIAYKHFTTDGSKMDKAMKLIGVVQEPTVPVVVENTTKATG